MSDAAQTDFELLDQWCDGDTKAADKLVRRHFDALYRFFSNKAGEGVEDLVQDTFLACTTARDRFRRESTFRTFLFATARNTLFAHYRKRRKLSREEDIGASAIAALDPSPSSVAAQKAEERLLLEGLRRISLDAQLIIELYEWEHLTGPEVAEVFGITEAAMRSRLYRAKQELKDQMEQLSASPEVLQSTMADLDGWAEALRAQHAR